MWVSIASEASCAAALQQAVENYGIFDTATLQAVLLIDAAGFARALCKALQVEPPAAQQSTATNEKVLMVDAASQTTADDVVDTATAEAMVAEALCMVDEAQHRERLADKREACLLMGSLGRARCNSPPCCRGQDRPRPGRDIGGREVCGSAPDCHAGVTSSGSGPCGCGRDAR